MDSTTQLRVRYVETDAMGIVHHASYVAWLELGRTELLRQLGQSYREWEKAGVHLSVGEVQVKYRAPAYFDDLVTVHTQVTEAARRRVGFSYRVEREGALLAEARTVHMVTGANGKASVLPDDFLRMLKGGQA